MRKFYRILLIFAMTAPFIAAGNAQGPIKPTGLLGFDEIIRIQHEGSDGIKIQAAELKPGYGAYDVSNRLRFMPQHTQSPTYTSNKQVDIIAGDFTGGTTDNYIYAYRDASSSVGIVIPHIDTAGTYTDQTDFSITGTPVQTKMLGKGDIDGDGNLEFIVLYEQSTGTSAAFNLYNVNKDLTVNKLTTIDDESFESNISFYFADFDGNGDDELVVGYKSSSPESGYYLKIYDFDASGNAVPKAKLKVPLTGEAANYKNVSIAAGDIDGDGSAEIVAAFGEMDPCGGTGCDDTFLYPFDVIDDPGTNTVDPMEKIVFHSEYETPTHLSANELSPLLLKAGDLNGDSISDIVLCGSYGLEVYGTVNNTLQLEKKATGVNYTDQQGYSYDFMDIADINGDHRQDVVVLDHFFSQEPGGNQYFTLAASSYDKDFKATTLFNQTYIDEISNGGGNTDRRKYAVALGDINGNSFRIGEGKHYRKTNIVQPLVILNAPPTHFDVLDDNVYDLNLCYNDNLANCGQYATYLKSTSETKMVNTTINSDWGVSSTLSGGASYLGVEVKAYMTGSYGEKFSKTDEATNTISIKTEIKASGDDLIYATVCDYDIWEYPVFGKNNEPMGNVIALVPQLTENRWFQSKSRSADMYIPKHEVGNILSYTPYINLADNPDSYEKIKGDYTGGDSYDLDQSSDINYDVNYSKTFTNSQTRENDIGMEVGGSVSGWGMEVSGSATYNKSEISTHSTTVESDININVHLGPIDRSLGEDNFNVTPYIYWAKNGALVVNYAARAILPGAGTTPTWWSANYGQKPDPTLILPWRLDPEKGLALEDEARRQQTKSLLFSPSEPVDGDTITITAYIHNFSLKETSDPVQVKFYMGDPANGGTLLTDITGNSEFQTSEAIPAQEFRTVSMHWKVPEGSSSFPRIYVVIDPDNMIDEIHETNNTGWAVLGKSMGNPSSGIFNTKVDQQQSLMKIYPNPVFDYTEIHYKMEKRGKAEIQLYDLQGRLLKNIMSAPKNAGDNYLSVNLNELARGTYLIKFNSPGHEEYQKIMIVR
ncbi:MAG TPA: FG-GAP-like repeat-containing protein [Bacteroidales bacterium]|nr:FG-GAP-like repeat-containing protein [Bacteroidales bacterium]